MCFSCTSHVRGTSLEAFILKEHLVVLHFKHLLISLSYQFSFVGSIGRHSAFLKVYCMYAPFNFSEQILCFEAALLHVPFLKLKLLIQSIKRIYLFTNAPKSMFALVFLSAWGCIYRLRFRSKNTHFWICNYRQAQHTRIICNDLFTVLKFELVS